MSAAAPLLAPPLKGVPAPGGGLRRNADRDVYRRWLLAHVPGGTVRYNRLQIYDGFVARWPDLRDWFVAPLPIRAVDRPDTVRGQNPHGAHVLMPYLVYLSLVQGVPLNYELLLVRSFRTPFTTGTYRGGLGVDVALFERHVARLTQLGYAAAGARGDLGWTLGGSCCTAATRT